jgi:Protein of unknown function (DUF3040)
MGLLRTAAHTPVVAGTATPVWYDERGNRMALSKDEQRTLDEIERALRDEKPCFKDYQAKRYLSSAQLKKLGNVLRFVPQDGDAHAGQACVECE